MTQPLHLSLDRTARTPLAEQIRCGITTAIENGVLAPGARLPSWQDLATQLGVARGTVKTAYEKLADAQLVVASRANGTRVAERPALRAGADEPPDPGSFMDKYLEFMAGPAIFQMGVPAQESLPARLFSRVRAYAARAELGAASLYPDPRGEPALRREIAAYLAIARGIQCSPSQILITGGFAGGLGLALRGLGLNGRRVWTEDPGFPYTRRGLELAGLSPVPMPVDGDGIDVGYGLRHAPDAALVVLTPGQQAPLGGTLSLPRRLQLLDWAAAQGAWVIEDDYLSELRLEGRAAPAPRLAGPRRTRDSYRLVQQDHQPGTAPGLRSRAAVAGAPDRRDGGVPRARTGAVDPAGHRGVHARGPLPAAPAAHQAALCVAARWAAGLPASARRRGGGSNRAGRAAAAAGRHRRRVDREGNGELRHRALAAVGLVCVRRAGEVRTVARHCDRAAEAGRGFPAIACWRSWSASGRDSATATPATANW
ncbi:hypothetical protein OJJOAM_000187 [Cupriavidus sp. H18C1]